MPVDSQMFVTSVAVFQNSHGLLPDGKVGPATLSIMRSTKPAVVESEEAHDFETVDEEEAPAIVKSAPAFGEDAADFEPAREGVSNCLIIDGQRVRLSDEMLGLGITASNYLDDEEHQFTQFRNRKAHQVTHLVIHESVTMSAAQTNRVLEAKRRKSGRKGKNGGKGWDYGIHLNMSPDGHISCHADLIRHRLVHANQLCTESVGLEVVNPYNPKFAKPPFTRTMDGPWWCWRPENGERVYTLPTDAQMRAIGPLCKFLCDNIAALPFEFPTKDLNRKNKRIDGWNSGKEPAPGIVAHRDFASHADGRYLLEHVIEQFGA